MTNEGNLPAVFGWVTAGKVTAGTRLLISSGPGPGGRLRPMELIGSGAGRGLTTHKA